MRSLGLSAAETAAFAAISCARIYADLVRDTIGVLPVKQVEADLEAACAWTWTAQPYVARVASERGDEPQYVGFGEVLRLIGEVVGNIRSPRPTGARLGHPSRADAGASCPVVDPDGLVIADALVLIETCLESWGYSATRAPKT